MLKIRYHSSFKRDYKRMKRRGMNMSLLHEAIELLARNENLPEHGIMPSSVIIKVTGIFIFAPIGY